MAKLGDVALGGVVKIKENGTAVDFFVIRHDYESSLNGPGRTLLWRRNGTDLAVEWQSDNAAASAVDYQNSDADEWLNEDYASQIDPELLPFLGTTFYSLTNRKNIDRNVGDITVNTTITRNVFLLSATECGATADSISPSYAVEGTKIDATSNETMICDSRHWLRTPTWTSTSNSGAVSVNADGKLTSAASANDLRLRPALTLPATLGVDRNGVLTADLPPEISSNIVCDTNMGLQSQGFTVEYTVTDDAEKVSVSEYLDDVLKRTFEAVVGETCVVECVSPENYQTVLNGSHTIKIVASDSRSDSIHTIRFTKRVTSASITLKYPLDADDAIQVAIMTVSGSIPEDAKMQVMLTNNANDEEPVWEDATAAIRAGENYVFTNQSAENGFAFNFMISVSRGEGDVGGYISNIGGAFQ